MECAINTMSSNLYNVNGNVNQYQSTYFNSKTPLMSHSSAPVEALYPCRKAGNAYTVKLRSHVPELVELWYRGTRREAKTVKKYVDMREKSIVLNADAVKLFRGKN